LRFGLRVMAEDSCVVTGSWVTLADGRYGIGTQPLSVTASSSTPQRPRRRVPGPPVAT